MIPEKMATIAPLRKLNSATPAVFCSCGEFAFLGYAGGAGGDDAQQGQAHASQRGQAPISRQEARQFAACQRRDEGADRGAQSATDGHAQADAQVADHQSPGQTAKAPHGAEQVAHE